ncbi:MAG: sigma-70 family RNA polymerase sigma factor [Verrucomicrobiaceae bacterium]|nr:sigma-70 family RNA polymerase sigma factor [Verrucomicrobiaceae bacterium]
MNDVTRLLEALQHGDVRAGEELLPLVYAELRQLARAKMAHEQPGHTLQATALVHEAWLRLGDQRFENRAHFFAAAAEAMRRILIDRARRRQAAKHGAGAEHVDVHQIEIAAPAGKDDDLLALHDALTALEAHDARKADLVKLRYFTGLSFEEAAEILQVSIPTAKRDWTYARAWLYRRIQDAPPGKSNS